MDASAENVGDVVEQDHLLSSLSWRELGVVGLGGGVGVGLRYLLVQHVPSVLLGHGTVGFVTPLFLINTLGAFLLGLLLPWFARQPRHYLRLLLTTGVLGGFTSYGALADMTRQQIIEHAPTGRVVLSLSVALGAGLAAVVLGHYLGTRRAGRSAQ